MWGTVALAVEIGASGVVVVGTIGGVLAGLFAPVISQRANERSARRSDEVEIARAALQLFETEENLEVLLCGEASVTRRRLFLLANQLRSQRARDECVALVALAGSPPVDASELDLQWSACVLALGEVARSG